MQRMKPIVRLQSICKSFDRIILNDLSLELYPGKIMGLIGKSGSGKSTLIKIIVGYYEPDKGSIMYEDKDIASNSSALRKCVGYTTQENSFYEKLTIAENMNYYASLYKITRKEKQQRITHLLDAVGLLASKNVLAGSISGGMKRRLDFAISLLHHPKIVILDEPTTGLDPLLVKKFWNVVTTIVKEEHIAVLVSTHILDEIKSYCDSVGILSSGKLITFPVTANLKLEKEFEKLP